MSEFDLIRRYFRPLSPASEQGGITLGIGDDCALQRIRPGFELAFSIDTLVEGVHFPQDYDPQCLGWRALAVAASDLAAMGASPACFTLALTVPGSDADWLEGFARGLLRASKAFGLPLAGGDTTRGPLTLSLQVHGEVPEGQALRRDGAQPGDLIAVSGTLGAAGGALAYLSEAQLTNDEQAILAHYHYPQPRFELGQALRGQASAAIDISDGLVADLGHVLDASGQAGRIDARSLPVSPALIRRIGDERARALALSAGDDYELCVTLSPDAWRQLPAAVAQALTVIGRVKSGTGLQVEAAPAGVQHTGYDHFGSLS